MITSREERERQIVALSSDVCHEIASSDPQAEAGIGRNLKKRRATTDHTDSTDKKAEGMANHPPPEIYLCSSSVSSVKSVVGSPVVQPT
jgi:hypothetical protein